MAMASAPTVAQFLNKQTTSKPPFFSSNRTPNILRRRLRFSPPQSSRPKRTEAICPVPKDQLPVNEYQSLSTSFPFSWASGTLVEYCSRLFATGLSFAVVVGLPVASADPDLSRRFLSVVSSGVIVVAIAVVRMYLGWAYVGNRLLSATVEYEETGWYDGQMWVKTAEVLTRDRLLGSFSVKPVLSRLKNTLVTLGVSLLVCVALLVNVDESHKKSNAEMSEERTKIIPGVYSDEAARSFEPDAFCGEPALP